MATHEVKYIKTTGASYSAFPLDEDLDITDDTPVTGDWTTTRVALTEDNIDGLFTASIPDTYLLWGIFEAGSTAPADWETSFTGDTITISSDPTVTVLSASASVPDRVIGTTITVFQNEVTDITVTLADTSIDLDGLDLEFVVEDQNRTDILSLATADITTADNAFTVTIPSTATDEIGNFNWALRDVTGTANTVLGHGVFVVAYAASDDA